MYNWDGVYMTNNIGKGINTHKYIILHHTGGIGESNLKTLLGLSKRVVSCHFYINNKGQAFKLADPLQITFHAGVSKWGNINGLNKCSLGIEIEGPGFTNIQFERVCDLVKYLRNTFDIPLENIIKHSDITQLNGNSEKKILWNGKTKARKVDLAPSFWQTRGYANYTEFRQKCF